MVTIIAGPHCTLEGPDHFNLLPYSTSLYIVVQYSEILIERF